MNLDLTVSELTIISRLLSARSVQHQTTICDNGPLIIKMTVLPLNSPPISTSALRALSDKFHAALNNFNVDLEF
jgi:hypothetical protein